MKVIAAGNLVLRSSKDAPIEAMKLGSRANPTTARSSSDGTARTKAANNPAPIANNQ
jgi:hypothetical protein